VNLIELYNVQIPLDFKSQGYLSKLPIYSSLFKKRNYVIPNWISGYHQTDLKFYLLRIGTNIGVDGFAAITAMDEERDSMGCLLGSYIMGMNPMNIGLVNQRINEMSLLGLRQG